MISVANKVDTSSKIDVEQGGAVGQNKQMIFLKKQETMESNVGNTNEETLSRERIMKDEISIKSTRWENILRKLFSTGGLIAMLAGIIIVGILLGLIPLFITPVSDSAQNTTITSASHQSSQAEQTTAKLLIDTSTTTTTTTTVTTTPSTTTELTSTEAVTTVETTTEAPTTTPVYTTLPTTEPTTTVITTTVPITTTLEPTTTVLPTTTVYQTTPPSCIVNPNKTSLLPSTYNVNNCANLNVYRADQMSLFTLYTFGYPVLQTITCYGSTMQLQCGGSQVIHVYTAYYGIQKDTNLNLCSNEQSQQSECFFSDTYTYVTNQCENQNSCVLNVNSLNFGDPCIGSLNKQLLVRYVCVDAPNYDQIAQCEQNNQTSICPVNYGSKSFFEQNWCEPSIANVSCPDGQLINILCAFYGIDASHKCPNVIYQQAPIVCYSQDSAVKVKSECNNKQNCSFEGLIGFEIDSGFVNVCPGFNSSLFIQWECVAAQQAPTTTNMALARQIPECDLNYTQRLNGSCVSSAFEPTFLLSSTQTYFGYPIYEQTACQGNKLLLACPPNMLIHVYAAYYGIQENTLSPSCFPSMNSLPTKCYVPNAFYTINKTCEYQNSCQLRATTNSLGGGDFCPSWSKQLFVQYQCYFKSTLNTTINQCAVNKTVPSICPSSPASGVLSQTWCDGTSMSISCGTRRISIVCAYYGIHPDLSSCNIQSLSNIPVCYYSSSQQIVAVTCNSKTSCSLTVLNTFSPDPCNGLDKALFVQWRCF